MKTMRNLFLVLSTTFMLSAIVPTSAFAQCAMCSLNAENSTQHGNTQGKGLNDGILFLLSMPFLVGGAVAILWYKKYRREEVKVSSLK